MRIDYELLSQFLLQNQITIHCMRVTPEFIHIRSIILQKHSNSGEALFRIANKEPRYKSADVLKKLK